MTFKDYLQSKKLSPRTIKGYQKQLKSFTEWLTRENIPLKGLSYNDLLTYVSFLRQKGLSDSTIVQQLGIVKHYLSYKVLVNEIKANAAQNLYIKGTIKKVPGKLLKQEEMDQLYKNYQPRQPANKIVLGLLIYQGLPVNGLQQLRPENIRLAEGKIYVPSTRRSNGRWLGLEAFQVISLQEYMNEKRPEIIEKTGSKSDKLIIGEKGSNELKARLMDMFAELKKLNPKVENAAQVRASVLVEKLKTMSLREVQYFAGHKYVSSTERYKLGNIENLKKQIEKYHPLNETK